MATELLSVALLWKLNCSHSLETKCIVFSIAINPLSAEPTKWSTQTIRRIVCLFGHFVRLALKGLKIVAAETNKNVFLFHFKSSFRSRENQILDFFRYSNFMASSNA